MGNELAVRSDLIDSLDDIQRISKMFLATGFIKVEDPRDINRGVAELATKILAGREVGFAPFASVNGISIIKGKPSFGGNLFATAVKRSPKYDYRIREKTDKVCTIEFFERVNGKNESLGIESFSLAEAVKAGTQNMDKWPKNMLFNRCISNGVKSYCPDVFDGVTVYTPEELGAEVDENGDYVESTSRPVQLLTNSNGVTPVHEYTKPAPDLASAKTLRQLNAVGNQLYGTDGWDEARHRGAKWASDGRTESSKELTEDEAGAMIAEINKKIAKNAESAAASQQRVSRIAEELGAGELSTSIEEVEELAH